MNRYIVLLVLFLTACAEHNSGESATVESSPDEMQAFEGSELTGQQAYEAVCAGCHAEGLNGAPRTGDPKDWVDRSWLWEAVLFEHARSGFEDMPAKGGDPSLDELTVTKAAEYMMTLTYPDLPPG